MKGFFALLDGLVKAFIQYLTAKEDKHTEKKDDPPIENVSPVKPPSTNIIIAPKTPDAYKAKFDQAKVVNAHLSEVKRICSKIMLHQDNYQRVQDVTNVPWYVIACIHNLESGLDFAACLHNGEHVIGNGKKTTLVPSGRGPFDTWHEAAVDAINLNPKRWEKLKSGNHDMGVILSALESFNGLGYQRRGKDSWYLWSYTTEQRTTGRYVADGVFDDKAVSKQCGCVAILKTLGVV